MKRVFFYILTVLFLLPSFSNAAVVNRSSGDRLRNGLVGHWTFDGPETNLATMKVTDRTGNATVGTMEGMSTSSVVVGAIGQALEFNGTNSDILPGYNAALDLDNNYTINAWIKPKKTAEGVIIRVSNSSSNTESRDKYKISVLSTGVKFSTGDGVSLGDSDAYAATIPQNTWTMITCTHSSGTAKSCYKDGVLISTATNDIDTTTNAPTSAFIGTQRNQAGNDFFKGTIDDIRVYGRQLSQAEITALYNQGTPSLANKSPNLRSTSGLIAQYTFDGPDMLTRVADKSGSGNNGFVTGITSTSSAVAAGKVGQGITLDGTNDKVITNSDYIGTSAVTIAAWIKPSLIDGNLRRIVTNGKTDFSIDTSNNRLIFTSDATNARSAAESLAVNTWAHIVVTRTSGGTANIYVNGVLSGSANQNSGTPLGGTTNVIIGNTSSGTTNTGFAGILDDVRIYNKVLTAAEVAALYNQTVPSTANKSTTNRLTDGLVGLWSFDGPDLLRNVTDKSGLGNHGYLLNYTSTSSSVTAGKVGQGLMFDANDDEVFMGSPASVDNLPVLTISVWAKANSYGENVQGYFVNKGGTSLLGWRFQKISTGTAVKFQVDYDGASDLQVNGTALAASDFGKWIHWVVTWDGTANTSGVHIYKNGAEVTYGSTSNGLGNRVDDSAQNLVIGNQDNAGTSRTFDGSMDEFRLYNRVLSAAEISTLYNLGR